MAAESAKPKIVVIEDEGLIAADLEARLKTAGYLVPGTADSAPKALQLIRKTTPDLVLMDIRLKGHVDGIEVAGQIREQMDIPVIYLTAYEDHATLERASQTQAFGYIKKPIATASLKGSIEMAIAKHRHERDLRAQRDWAVASFAAVPQAVLVTDSQGRVTYLNAHAEELTGWKVDDALGRECWELLRLYHHQSGTPVQNLVTVALLQGEVIPLPEGICHKKDVRTSYAVEGSIAPRWHDGRAEGTVVAISDVTRAVFDEEQARQEGKQEALRRLADGIVRHLGPGQIEELPKEAAGYDDASTKSLDLKGRLRAFLQAPVVHPERVDVREVLDRLEEAWKLIEPRLKMALELDSAPAQADSWQLTRALVNILLHARRRMKSASALAVELSSADIQQVIHSIRIRISYTTEEEPAAIERVFEPAWRGPSEDLHSAYQLVKGMGGLVAARLERGDNAVFDIYLPRVEAMAAGVMAPKRGAPAVLLVDANAEVRRLIYGHFQENGEHLLETAGCEEAVLLADLYPGDIGLAIVNLPASDPARDRVPEQLSSVRPGIQVRLLNGYLWPCRAAAGEGFELATERHLTKWDLLEWAREYSHSEGTE